MVVSFFDQFNIIDVSVYNYDVFNFFEGMDRGLIYCKRVTWFC